MPKIKYIKRKFKADTLALVDIANSIIEEYHAQGFDLTLRQLYYQMVARDIVANSQREYKRLGNIINNARLAGLVDWHRIVDRTRGVRRNTHWDNPAEIIQSAAYGYGVDKWENQDFRIEVWIEKDALVGVISGACNRLDVPYFSCRGYTSQSEMWNAARRLSKWVRDGQTPIIMHLGDHDPSGMDMTRDISDRLKMFMGGLEVDRLALNWDQIDEYGPPPNPTKLNDSRANAYIAEFGRSSWELDALEPRVLESLIERAINQYRDLTKWGELASSEEKDKLLLRAAADRWSDVVSCLAS